jgi:hypothetical protein
MGNGRDEFAKGGIKTANYRERRKLVEETKQELNRLGVGDVWKEVSKRCVDTERPRV